MERGAQAQLSFEWCAWLCTTPAREFNMGCGMKSLCLVLLGCGLLAACARGQEPLRVGAYENPPKVFTTAAGRTTGLFPEVLQAIAKEQAWEIVYVHGTWQECLDRLSTGEIDLMIDMAVSNERRELYDFSEEPVLVNWGTAFSRADLPVQSFLDMQDRTVAVMRGSIHTEGPQGIKALTAQFGVPCRFLEADDYHEVLMLLDAKQADIGIVNRLFGTLYGDKYEVVPTSIIFNPRMLQFSTRKGSERGARLLAAIDESLRRFKADPESIYHKTLAYYLGGGTREWLDDRQRRLRRLELTPAERRWLEAHPRVRFAVDPGFAPFEFLSDEGHFCGMAADFVGLLAHKTGLEFTLVKHATWSESIQALRDREIDMLPCIGYSEERAQFISYGTPYLNFARVIVTRIEAPIQALADLVDRRVGIQADSSHHAFLREHTAIEPQLYRTFEECVLAVSKGELDATIGNLAVTTRAVQELALTNVKLAAYASAEPQSLAVGVRSDWPELTSIIDRALASVTAKERSAILANWLPIPAAASENIDLTQAEREWLLMHPRIRVAWDHEWAPIEFAGPDGTPQGISMEYLRAIESILGVKFDTSLATDWQETYAKLERREIDMSSCLAITPERLEHLDFTDTYLTSPVVLFGRGNLPYIRQMSELQGLKLAVVKDYATDEWITRDFPEMGIVRARSIGDAFRLVIQGDVDVFAGSILPGNYYLSRLRHHDIKIVGETPYAYKLRMAVRKDWPLFAGILRKALRSLPEVERNAFYRKWVWLRYEHGFDYSLFGKIVACAAVVVLLFAYWNRRLAAEIGRRRRVQAALLQSEKQLRASYADLKASETLKENLTHMIVHDMRSPLMSITGALELLQCDLPEIDWGDDGERDLQLAETSAGNLSRMIMSVLDVTRLESNQMPLDRKTVDLKAVVDCAVEELTPQARFAGVRVVSRGESSPCDADPAIIQRVLANLLANAIEVSPTGCEVEVMTAVSGCLAVAEVRDSGRGIPPEFRQRVFDKFVSRKTAIQGKSAIGLGLAFCKLAVEAHGGSIEVQSEEGKGSTFRFSIPAPRPEEGETDGELPSAG